MHTSETLFLDRIFPRVSKANLQIIEQFPSKWQHAKKATSDAYESSQAAM